MKDKQKEYEQMIKDEIENFILFNFPEKKDNGFLLCCLENYGENINDCPKGVFE